MINIVLNKDSKIKWDVLNLIIDLTMNEKLNNAMKIYAKLLFIFLPCIINVIRSKTLALFSEIFLEENLRMENEEEDELNNEEKENDTNKINENEQVKNNNNKNEIKEKNNVINNNIHDSNCNIFPNKIVL